MTSPITPDEIAITKMKTLPEQVIVCWNSLIAVHFTSGSAVIKQDEVVTALCSAMNVDRSEVFEKHWLNVEEVYEAAGWEVIYDKPAYNESHAATFTFSRETA